MSSKICINNTKGCDRNVTSVGEDMCDVCILIHTFIAKKYKGEKDKGDSLSKKLASLNRKFTDIKSKLKEQKTMLYSTVPKQEYQEVLQQQKKSIAHIDQLQVEILQLQSNKKKLQKNIKSLKETHSSMERKLIEENDKLREGCDILQKENNELQQILEGIQEKNRTFTEELIFLKSKLNEAETKLDTATVQNEEQSKLILKNNKTIQEWEDKVTFINMELEIKNQKINELDFKLSKSSEAGDEYDQEIQRMKHVITNRDTVIAAMKSKLVHSTKRKKRLDRLEQLKREAREDEEKLQSQI